MDELTETSKQLNYLDSKFNLSERSARALIGKITPLRVNMLYSVILGLSELGATTNEILKVLIVPGHQGLDNKMESVSSAIQNEKYEVRTLVQMAIKALAIIRAG